MRTRTQQLTGYLGTAVAILLLAAAATAQGVCNCKAVGGGHDCSGWNNSEYDCSHSGFVHGSCSDYHTKDCTVTLGEVEELETRLAAGLHEALRSGDPRFLAAAVDVANGGIGGATAQVAWSSGRLKISDCGGNTLVELATSDLGTGESREAVIANLASRGAHAAG